jgi:hypothetical protein
MPEHQIRFRGGWEFRAIGNDRDDVLRLTLPVVWTHGNKGPVRLTRRFGRPPIDTAVESARLELRAVPGLRSVHLNDVDLGRPPAGVDDWSVPLDSLESRNTLTLVVVLDDIPPDAIPGGWGSIALLIASRTADEP